MKLIGGILLLGLFYCDSKVLVNFVVNDFLRTKNVKITISACWDKGEAKAFMELVSKPVVIYNDRYDFNEYTRHLANDNYFVIDLNRCDSSWKLLEQLNKTELFRSPLKYLILTSDLDELNHLLKNYTVYPSSDIIIAHVGDDDVNLLQPYRINRNTDIIWEDYGTWSENGGLVEHLAHLPVARRRRNFQQANLDIIFVITDNDTWNHLDDFRYPRIDSFTKQSYATARSLLDYLNVSATYIGTSYFGYYQNDTREWNGIVGELNRRRGDVSGSNVYLTPERFEMIDFIKVQSPLAIKFILKKPPLSFVRNIFVLAFEGSLWLFLGIITIMFTIALLIILNLEAKYMPINNKSKFSCVDIFLIIFEAVCQQGTTTEPKRYSSRIAAVILFMNFMFIYVAYSAYIVVMLQSQIEIKSAKQLLETQMEVGAAATNYMKFYLTSAKDEVRKQLYERKIHPDGFYSLEDGMAKVHKGFFAFHTEVGGAYDYILEKFTDYDICSLQELEGYTKDLQAYTTAPKNSPYKEIFKSGLLRIEEYGIQKRNFIRYVIKPKCYTKGSTFDSVGIVEMYQCLLVFVYGLLLSVAICIIENLANYLHNRKKQ